MEYIYKIYKYGEFDKIIARRANNNRVTITIYVFMYSNI